MPPISAMIKPASGLCNMRCKYCFYADEMKKRGQSSYGMMTEETLRNVIKELLSYADGSCTIAFQGGEPTLAGLNLYQKCLQIEREYNSKDLKISHALQTNGFVLDQEWCRFFAENHFLIGLSLDGICSTHDALRKDLIGQGTYSHTLNAANMLSEAGVEYNILTVVNRKTAPRIRRIYESYKELGFQWQQYIACLDPIGEPPGKTEYSLTPEAYGQFLIELFNLWKEDLKRGYPVSIRQFDNYLGILLGIHPESCEQQGTCGLQTVIEADGSVFPCDFYALDDYKLGNLNQDSLSSIRQCLKQQTFLDSSLNYPHSCRTCKWFSICRGGCRRHREYPGVLPGENYFCKSYQMFFETCYHDMEQIAASTRSVRNSAPSSNSLQIISKQIHL